MLFRCRTFSGPRKNLIVLSTAFLLIFTGYNCSVNLLSSLNIDEGLGVVSQSILYATFILGAVTAPPLVMRWLGVKRTIGISALLYAPYVAANFHPSWYVFVPTAVVIGLAAGPLWAAALSYLAASAKRLTISQGKANSEGPIFLFMGILFMFFGFSNVFGNIASFIVLRPDGGYVEDNHTKDELKYCGVNFCDWLAIDKGLIHKPPQDQVFILTGIYVCCVVAGGLLILLMLDDVDLSEVGIAPSETTSFSKLLAEPLRRFSLSQHWFLLPITIFAGVEESFLFGDFTKAYVACSWGIYHIGLSMISCGVVISFASPLLGRLVEILDRAYIFGAAGVIHAAGIVLLWFWTTDYPKWILYLIPALWGLVTSVWQAQVRALYGVFFPDAKGAAFAIQACLEAVGFLIGFAISSKVCTLPKLVLLVVLLVVSLAGYAAAEVKHRKSIPVANEKPDVIEKNTRL